MKIPSSLPSILNSVINNAQAGVKVAQAGARFAEAGFKKAADAMPSAPETQNLMRDMKNFGRGALDSMLRKTFGDISNKGPRSNFGARSNFGSRPSAFNNFSNWANARPGDSNPYAQAGAGEEPKMYTKRRRSQEEFEADINNQPRPGTPKPAGAETKPQPQAKPAGASQGTQEGAKKTEANAGTDNAGSQKKAAPKETNLYDMLEVAPGASAAELKRAHRKQSLKYHPDRNMHLDPNKDGAKIAENLSKYQEINAAYDILSNPTSRATYDRDGSQARY